MDVKRFYQTIGGNYEAALSIMMNDAFITRMLGKFFTNNTYGDVISSYENKDFAALFAASHALKGVAGNLALTPLFEISSVITEACRNGQEPNLDAEIEECTKRYKLIHETYLKEISC